MWSSGEFLALRVNKNARFEREQNEREKFGQTKR
jgi:hypothetical protein